MKINVQMYNQSFWPFFLQMSENNHGEDGRWMLSSENNHGEDGRWMLSKLSKYLDGQNWSEKKFPPFLTEIHDILMLSNFQHFYLLYKSKNDGGGRTRDFDFFLVKFMVLLDMWGEVFTPVSRVLKSYPWLHTHSWIL